MKRKEYEIEYQRLKAELDEWLKAKNINVVLLTTTVFADDPDTEIPPHETPKE